VIRHEVNLPESLMPNILSRLFFQHKYNLNGLKMQPAIELTWLSRHD